MLSILNAPVVYLLRGCFLKMSCWRGETGIIKGEHGVDNPHSLQHATRALALWRSQEFARGSGGKICYGKGKHFKKSNNASAEIVWRLSLTGQFLGLAPYKQIAQCIDTVSSFFSLVFLYLIRCGLSLHRLQKICTVEGGKLDTMPLTPSSIKYAPALACIIVPDSDSDAKVAPASTTSRYRNHLQVKYNSNINYSKNVQQQQ